MIVTYIYISMTYKYMLRNREQIFDINLYCWTSDVCQSRNYIVCGMFYRIFYKARLRKIWYYNDI